MSGLHDHEHTALPATGGSTLAPRRLRAALIVTTTFMVVEAVGGWLSGSLALLADAGHMLADAGALSLALIASHVALRPANQRYTYGWRRFEVLAAFVNALLLLGIVVFIIVEAAGRWFDPQPIDARLMLGVALAGAGANLLSAWLLHADQSRDLNVSAAYLHVLSDLAGSGAAAIAAIVILVTGWTGADPLLSLLVAALIARSAWSLLRQTTHILLEGTPPGFDVARVAAELPAEVPGIEEIHDLHAWSVGSNELLVTLHARLAPGADPSAVLAGLKHELAVHHGVTQSTIQLEAAECADRGAGLQR